ncbi:MAG: hypothetical protein AABY13_01455 [Nanoarchaeota archaeon]
MRTKHGMIRVVAEFWSFVAMFFIIVVFLFLFKFCGSPTLQQIEGQQLDVLQDRQDALLLMQAPTVYRGQNVTIAYLIALGSTPGEYDKVAAQLLQAVKDYEDIRGTRYAISVTYPDRTLQLTRPGIVPLDTFRIPGPGGRVIRIDVGRTSSADALQLIAGATP